jgi:hypothetical protein
MHTSYKDLNNGIARKEGISNHKQKAVTKPGQSTETQGRIRNKMN